MRCPIGPPTPLAVQSDAVSDSLRTRACDVFGIDVPIVQTGMGWERVIRTDVVDKIEKASPLTRFPKAALAALEFRSETGTSLRDLVKEGLAMRKNQDLSLAQLALAANAPMLIKATMVDGKPDVGILPTGQVTGVIDALPMVVEVLADIMSEAEATLGRLAR